MNKLEEKITIEYESPDRLKEYPGNPRSWDEKSKKDVKTSLQRHGFTAPLLVQTAPGRENIVLSGNLRLVVAREMKLREVPVVKVRIDDPKIEKEITLTVNKENIRAIKCYEKVGFVIAGNSKDKPNEYLMVLRH